MIKEIIKKVENLETLTKAEIMDYINYSITEHNDGGHIETVITVSKGGYKGKDGRYMVRYPRKVEKGKKVKVYMVVKKGDVKAMVCLGTVK